MNKKTLSYLLISIFLLSTVLSFSAISTVKAVSTSTFGYGEIGETTDYNPRNNIDIFRFQTDVTGFISKLTVYASISQGTPKSCAVVYADDNGAPSTLLGLGIETVITASYAWQDLTGLNVPVISGQYYWIGYWTGYDNGVDRMGIKYRAGDVTNQEAYKTYTYYSDHGVSSEIFTACDFGVPSGYTNNVASIYATVISGVSGPVPVPQSFSIVHISDTQGLTETAFGEERFSSLTQWIIDNQEIYNILAVMHTGDIVELGQNTDQWVRANNSMGKLLDAGIPYGFNGGNHDVYPNGDSSSIDYGIDHIAFNVKDLANRYYWVDSFGSRNTVITFSFDSIDFLDIQVEYLANATVLAWLTALLETYSNLHYNIIVSTHAYLTGSGSYQDAGATSLKATLDSFPNVFLTLNGHEYGTIPQTHLRANARESLHFDYQQASPLWYSTDSLELITFDVDAETATVNTYLDFNSTWLDSGVSSFQFDL